MKRKYLVLTVVFTLAIISAVIMYFSFKNSSGSPALPEELILNKDWTSEDEITINEIVPLLKEMLNINDFLNSPNFNNQRNRIDKREFGLGYSRTNFGPSGRYLKIYVSILTDKNNNSIESYIDIGGRKNLMEKLDKKYNLLNIQEASITYLYENAYIDIRNKNINLYEAFVNDYAQYFQINSKIYIPEELKTEYETLFNAGMYTYRVGTMGNKVPKEREALEKILEMNNKDILFSIISSPKPEARLYAIEGLFRDRINDIINENEYADILNKIIALKTNVTLTWGDVIHHTWIQSTDDIYKMINNEMNM
jgi:hypothetical protein